MSETPNALLSPFQLGALSLKNRVVMAPLTRNRSPDTIPTDLNVTYYAQRASAGLIITEGTQISDRAVGYPATPGIHSKAQIAGWRKVTDAVHDRGGKIVCQLWHCGRVSHPSLLPDAMLPHAPSAIQPEGQAITASGMQDFVTPHAVTLDEIHQIIADYRHAAECAKQAGFDGVEVHSANGYLLDQFLRDGTNTREDEYGGSRPNRTRLLLEVLHVVCDVWGADRVGVRLSPVQPFNDIRDTDPESTFRHVVSAINPFGLAYLHVTRMGEDAPGAAGPFFDPDSLKALWNGAYMTNSGFDQHSANTVIENGQADLVAFGQAYIANPDLVERFAENASLNTPDPDTFYGGDAHGYTDYPSLAESA